MKVALATKNKDKIVEIKEILKGLNLTYFTFYDSSDIPDVVEDGLTLRENAEKKARHCVNYTNCISIADDTGLEVDILKGKPGVRSSRFAGEDATYADNNKKLLSMLKGISKEKRTATFRCVAALVYPSGKEVTFEGSISGYIGYESKGEAGFGYDPLFVVGQYGKTLAELGSVKNKISHRAKAFLKLKRYIKKEI